MLTVNRRHVIIAMHHPPVGGWGNLEDADAFWDVVDDSNVDLIVCGHYHASWEMNRQGVPVVCVGGFMEDDSDALIVDAGSGDLSYFWWNAWA